MASIQAENGLGKRKWDLLRRQCEELLYKYKFPKIIHLDINAKEGSKQRMEFETFLGLQNLRLHKAKDWT